MNQTSPFGRPLHYEIPCHVFPGDENIAEGDYRSCLDNWYATILPEFEVAAAAHDISLEPGALERGRRMLSGQYWLDELLDRTPGSAELYGRLIGSLPLGSDIVHTPESARPELDTAISLLRNATQSLPEKKQQQIVESGMAVRHLTEQQVATASIATYIRSRREEGKVTGRLIAHVLVADLHEVPGAYQRWLEHTVACLSLMDHAVDLPDDYANSLTKVTPTRVHQLRLVAAAACSFSMTLTSMSSIKASLRAFRRPLQAIRYFREYQRLESSAKPTTALLPKT